MYIIDFFKFDRRQSSDLRAIKNVAGPRIHFNEAIAMLNDVGQYLGLSRTAQGKARRRNVLLRQRRRMLVERLECRLPFAVLAQMVEDALPLRGINNSSSDSSNPSAVVYANNTAYFSASDGLNGTELWRIDELGFAQIVENSVPGGGINPGLASSSPSMLTNANGTLYFSANDGTNGTELWRVNSSGVAELVEDNVAGGGLASGAASSTPNLPSVLDGQLYFRANGLTLWRVNHSGIAESVVVEGSPGTSLSNPSSMTSINGTVYFAGSAGATTGNELWYITPSGNAVLVEDAVSDGGINPGAENASPRNLTNVNGQLFFSANDGTNGEELWRVDALGVASMVDGGINSSAFGSNPYNLTNVNGTLFFTASDGVNGNELWRIGSGGVAEIVEDAVILGGINPGGLGSTPGSLANFGGTLYFTAETRSSGREFWRVNALGIAEMIHTGVAGDGINPGPSSSSPSFSTSVGGTIYFLANDGANGNELWRINGLGFAEIVDDSVAGNGIAPGALSILPSTTNPILTNVNGTLYFLADDSANGQELWRVNDSGIAQLVEDRVAGGGIGPGITTSAPRFPTNANGVLYFSANDSVSGQELWRVNAAGIAELVENVELQDGINARALNVGSLFGGFRNSSLQQKDTFFENVNGALYFNANDGINGTELWRLLPSGATELVEDSIPGGGIRPGNLSSEPSYLTNINGTLFFTANDGTNGTEVWKINNLGLAEMVEDAVPNGGIRPSPLSSITSITTNRNPPAALFKPNPYFTNVNGVVYFMANDGTNGTELWRVNNTGIAEMVEDSIPGNGIGINSFNNPFVFTSSSTSVVVFPALSNVNGTLYFRANDGTNGHELWRINSLGVAEMVEDGVAGGGIRTGSTSSIPQEFHNLDGVLFFAADGGLNIGVELWRINSAGIAEVVEDSIPGGGISPSGSNSLGPIFGAQIFDFYFAANNGTAYFRAFDSVNGAELWQVGTTGIATMIEDSVAGGGIAPLSSSSSPSYVHNVGGTIYFGADDGTNGKELWRINESGLAEMVEDSIPGSGIRPGTESGYIATFNNVNGTLYFLGNDGTNGLELWRVPASGIAEMVDDSIGSPGIDPTTTVSNFKEITNVDGTLYFTLDDGTNGRELWRINEGGLAELVEDAIPGGGIGLGALSSSPDYLTNVNGTLFFSANDGSNGIELWRISGADSVPPTVSSVIAASSNWSPTFIDSVDGKGSGAGNGLGHSLASGSTISNSAIDRIYIQFSEPVVGFDASNVKLLGVNTADYASSISVSYDAVHLRGVISFSVPVAKDKLRIGISDAIKDGSMNSLDGDLNGSAGGLFELRFNVLVGDANNDGSVNGGDLPFFAASFNKSAGSGTYNARADWNSDGSVNGGDLPLFAANFNQSLPVGEPAAIVFPPPSPPESTLDEEFSYAPIIDEEDADEYFEQLDSGDELSNFVEEIEI